MQAVKILFKSSAKKQKSLKKCISAAERDIYKICQAYDWVFKANIFDEMFEKWVCPIYEKVLWSVRRYFQ